MAYKLMNQDSTKNTKREKNFISQNEALDKLMEGINGVGDAVKITLGAKGKNALIKDVKPFVTNDGITIAQSIHFDNEYAEQGAELLREVALRTNKNAGDGTTTSIVLTQALLKEGIQENAYGISLKESLDEVKDKLLKKIEKLTIKVTPELAEKVGIISSESEKYGKMIADTFNKLGKDAHIEIQTSYDDNEKIESFNGVEIFQGYISDVFKTNQSNSTLEDPLVLVTTEHFVLADILPLLNEISLQYTRPFVLITKELQSESLRALVQNHLMGNLQTVIIKEPLLFSAEFFEDCAKVFGTKVISPQSGKRLKDINVSDLGTCKKLVTDYQSMKVIGGKNVGIYATEEEDRLKRIGKWNEPAQRRIGGLKAKMANMYISAPSEQELSYKRLKVEDAINAVKSALNNGVLPGGGTIMYTLSKELGTDTAGERVMKKALQYPIKQIIQNSGNNPDKILPHITKKGGYNAKTEQIVNDMVEEGIIDPVEVTKNAIINSISVAGTILTTDIVII